MRRSPAFYYTTCSENGDTSMPNRNWTTHTTLPLLCMPCMYSCRKSKRTMHSAPQLPILRLLFSQHKTQRSTQLQLSSQRPPKPRRISPSTPGTKVIPTVRTVPGYPRHAELHKTFGTIIVTAPRHVERYRVASCPFPKNRAKLRATWTHGNTRGEQPAHLPESMRGM